MSSVSLQPIVCCLGDPLAGNPMQLLMERAFAAAGLDWRFLSFEVPGSHLEDAVKGMRALGFQGAAFTSPHQVAVIPFLDRLTDEATAIGAVNCAFVSDGQWVGDNTDGPAFSQALRRHLDPTDAHVVVLGAGGTARAVASDLARSSIASLTLVNRTAERAERLAGELKERCQIDARASAWSGNWEVPAETTLLVQATTVGWCEPDERPAVDLSACSETLVVADVIFNPPETRLIQEARRRGLTTMSGVEMMAGQVALAYERWTGSEPTGQVIRETLEEYLEV